MTAAPGVQAPRHRDDRRGRYRLGNPRLRGYGLPQDWASAQALGSDRPVRRDVAAVEGASSMTRRSGAGLLALAMGATAALTSSGSLLIDPWGGDRPALHDVNSMASS